MNNKNMAPEGSPPNQGNRRDFIRKAMYSTPVLLTLPALPSFAQVGSGSGDPGNDIDVCPDGLMFIDLNQPSPFDPQGRPWNQIPIEEGGLPGEFICVS